MNQVFKVFPMVSQAYFAGKKSLPALGIRGWRWPSVGATTTNAELPKMSCNYSCILSFAAIICRDMQITFESARFQSRFLAAALCCTKLVLCLCLCIKFSLSLAIEVASLGDADQESSWSTFWPKLTRMTRASTVTSGCFEMFWTCSSRFSTFSSLRILLAAGSWILPSV